MCTVKPESFRFLSCVEMHCYHGFLDFTSWKVAFIMHYPCAKFLADRVQFRLQESLEVLLSYLLEHSQHIESASPEDPLLPGVWPALQSEEMKSLLPGREDVNTSSSGCHQNDSLLFGAGPRRKKKYGGKITRKGEVNIFIEAINASKIIAFQLF
jgi:hypothetical protein